MARNTRGRVSADEVGTVRRLRYEQVFDFVVALIADQGLVPGDRLPSSTDLADLTGVSLISVRRALDELERGGKVQRQQGVGTFVAHERIRAEPTRTGELLGTLVDGNPLQEISTKLLGIAVGRPSDNIVRALAHGSGMRSNSDPEIKWHGSVGSVLIRRQEPSIATSRLIAPETSSSTPLGLTTTNSCCSPTILAPGWLNQ
jgi:DNA-binding transcriptional regulator YhcF (GntR family)